MYKNVVEKKLKKR